MNRHQYDQYDMPDQVLICSGILFGYLFWFLTFADKLNHKILVSKHLFIQAIG